MNNYNAVFWFLNAHANKLTLLNKNSFNKFSKKIQLIKTHKDLLFFLNSVKIPRISERAQTALAKWFEGKWKIILINKIPNPQEMLEIQSKGGRFVSWLPEIQGAILDKKDNWEFMLHDLMHAERFFHNAELYFAQVGFFKWLLDQSLNLSGFEWDYLRSDMNTHPIHSLKFLKHLLNRQGVDVAFNIPHWEIINSPLMSEKMTEEINHFFKSYCNIKQDFFR